MIEILLYFSLLGYLNGAEDYYQHTREYNGKPYLDLRNNSVPIKTESGHYSAKLFTSKAIDIVTSHDTSEVRTFSTVIAH